MDDVRQQYPQYNDMSDTDLADALHTKFYSDMPKDDFTKKIGLGSSQAEPADHGLSERQNLSPVGKALSPITSYPVTYDRMNKDARDQMSRGVSQIANHDSLTDPQAHGISDVAGGLANTAAGAAGYVASPISAAYRSIVGQPIEDTTGIPREYSEFAAQLATPGIGLTGRAPVPSGAPARALTPGEEVSAAAGRLSQSGSPVQVPRAVSTDNMAVQQAGAVTSNIPIAGTPLVKASEKAIDQLGTKADEVAQGYGDAGSVAQAGDAARSSIKDWISGESAANTKKLYDRVDNLVNPESKVELINTRGVAGEIVAERTAAHLPNGKAVDSILSAVQDSDGLTYQGIKTLRSKIGEAMSSGILPEGMSGGDLKRIYSGLTDDLRSSVLVGGGESAVGAFDRANKYYKLVSDRRESLAKIVGADGNAPAETVFNRIEAMAGSTSRADIAKLAQARKAMGPDDWNDLVSTIVGRLGRDVEGNFSPQRFITAYGKISDAGKTTLFRSTDKSDLASHLDDIARVSSRFKELQKFANPSGSARAGLGGLIGAGAFAEPLTTMSTVLGGRIVAEALSRPATAASVARVAKAQQSLALRPTTANVAIYGIATRNLINTLGAKNVSPADFMKSIQGPVPATADQKQQ